MDKLVCECRRSGLEMIVTIAGAVDHHSARAIREKIDRALNDCRAMHLVMDLYGVDFMDSAGLGLILGRYTKMCQRGGSICLRNPPEDVIRILRLAGAEKYIPVEYVKQDYSGRGSELPTA